MFSEDIRLKVNTILTSKRSDDLKLFEIIQICKDELKSQNVQLYYALLGWKDAHLKELHKEQAEWLRAHASHEFSGDLVSEHETNFDIFKNEPATIPVSNSSDPIVSESSNNNGKKSSSRTTCGSINLI